MRKAEIFQGNGIYFFNGNGEINFCLKWRLVSLPLGEGGPLAVDEVD